MRAIIAFAACICLLFACQQQNTQPNPPSTPSTTSFFIQASINGTNWSAVQPNNGCTQHLLTYPDIDYPNDIIHVGYIAGFDQDSWVSPITQVLDGELRVGFSGFTHNYTDYTNDPNVFYSGFAGISSVFYLDSGAVAGPEVAYLDANGEYWSTRYGDQSSSSFVISSNSSFNNGAGIPEQHVGGTFFCTLYKESDPSQTKAITNGSFKLAYQRY